MSKSIFIAAVALVVSFSSCKKEVTQYGQLGLNLSTLIDSNVVSTEGLLYPDPTGRLLAINDARFYISGVSVQNSNGAWFTISNSLLLKIYENQNYRITSPVPSGSYTAIRFYVGLDSVTNAGNPLADTASKGVDSVLSAYTEHNMYFGAGEGFKFFSFSGYVLPSGSHSPVAVSYQLGGNSSLQLVTLNNLNFTIETGKIHVVSVGCDYGKLLQGMNIGQGSHDNGNSFGSASQKTTAGLVATNIQNMFVYPANQ